MILIFGAMYDEMFGQQQGPQSRRPGPANQLDLAAYQWLIDIYVTSGALSDADARQMLQHGDATVIQRAMVCRDMGTPSAPQVFDPQTAQTTDGDTVPSGVHLGEHRSSRAYMLDWDTRHNSLTPETADGTNGQSSMREMFTAHRRAQLQAAFGAEANMDYVRSAIEIAEGLGRADVASSLRATLFRVNQYAMVESLNVEDSQRYAPGGGSTYCNIYAYDMVTALGGYLPRVWWYQRAITRIQNGAQVVTREEYRRMQQAGENVDNHIAPIYAETVHEMNANALTAWMREWGQYFGWTEADDAAAAQEQANSGKVVIVLAANANPRRSGHVTVVLAESSDHEAPTNDEGEIVAPLQSQAGSSNYKYGDEAGQRGRNNWWNNASHTNGGFWVFNGATRSPIITPEQIGASQ